MNDVLWLVVHQIVWVQIQLLVEIRPFICILFLGPYCYLIGKTYISCSILGSMYFRSFSVCINICPFEDSFRTFPSHP